MVVFMRLDCSNALMEKRSVWPAILNFNFIVFLDHAHKRVYFVLPERRRHINNSSRLFFRAELLALDGNFAFRHVQRELNNSAHGTPQILLIALLWKLLDSVYVDLVLAWGVTPEPHRSIVLNIPWTLLMLPALYEKTDADSSVGLLLDYGDADGVDLFRWEGVLGGDLQAVELWTQVSQSIAVDLVEGCVGRGKVKFRLEAISFAWRCLTFFAILIKSR